MEFQIVKFPEENDAVAVVAKPWMVGEVCYWPPPPNNVNKLVKNYAEPNFETWVKCKALIVGNAYGSYNEARQNLKAATYTSDFEEQRSATSASKSKRQVSLPTPPEIDESGSVIPSDANVILEENENLSREASSVTQDQDVVYFVSPAIDTNEKEVQTDPCEITQLLQMVKGIQLALAEQGEILHTILDGGKGRSASNTRISMELQKFTFPITNTVELEKLNDMVKSSDVAKGDLITIVSGGVRGYEEVDVISKMMKKLMTDDLLSKYSLKGMQKKLSLSTLADIKYVLHSGAAILMSPLTPDHSKIDDGISRELTKAGDRVYKRNKKQPVTNNLPSPSSQN
ncbi:hypothetical protein Fcan01_24403 [Folsomia candida]|uniref:DUF4806 domain-containing protein n=2 Tax=Folsomia candida TaxID=158441 RepID=A0A226D786_FOLCA|nr:hypothetical protein Fcan01_24394 [Folsomia candida]OXA41028.1 hypothetical protein Fcan01_24403 [Folsomia candida]